MTQQKVHRIRPLTPLVRIDDPAEVRAWALDQGYDISDRGRLPEAIEVAFCEAKLAQQQDR